MDNIKIIRIEKTNEPLGATVRNEGDAVIIGNVIRFFIIFRRFCIRRFLNFNNFFFTKDVSYEEVRPISLDFYTKGTRFSR